MTDRTVGDIIADLDAAPLIGDNGAPEPTPLEQHRDAIDALYMEAENWLDGTPIANQAQADEVTRLRDGLKKAWKAADGQRAAEKKPHDDAGKAVQTAWKPHLDRADKAEKAAGTALSKWLIAEQARAAAAAAEIARLAREADEKARTQHQAAAQSGDLAALDAAEAEVDNAAFLAREAKAADRFKPQAKVEGMTRAATLRTVWDVALATSTDEMPQPDRELMRWAWQTQRARVAELCLDLAREAVRKGGRTIPGCDVTSRQTI